MQPECLVGSKVLPLAIKPRQMRFEATFVTFCTNIKISAFVVAVSYINILLLKVLLEVESRLRGCEDTSRPGSQYVESGKRLRGIIVLRFPFQLPWLDE